MNLVLHIGPQIMRPSTCHFKWPSHVRLTSLVGSFAYSYSKARGWPKHADERSRRCIKIRSM